MQKRRAEGYQDRTQRAYDQDREKAFRALPSSERWRAHLAGALIVLVIVVLLAAMTAGNLMLALF